MATFVPFWGKRTWWWQVTWYFPGWLLLRTPTVAREGLETHAEMTCLSHTHQLGKDQQQGRRAARGSCRNTVVRTGRACRSSSGWVTCDQEVSISLSALLGKGKGRKDSGPVTDTLTFAHGKKYPECSQSCAPCRTQIVHLNL